jgi:hypothetical protein
MNRFEQNVDVCSMKKVLDAFRSADASLAALPIVQSDALLYRRPLDSEAQ